MPALSQTLALLRQMRDAVQISASVFARDVGRGMLEIGHNSLALVGLIAVGALVFGLGRADLRGQLETSTLQWLQTRQEARAQADGSDNLAEAMPEGSARATATDLADLPRQQASLANWIARRYRVAPEPMGALVQEAFSTGRRAGLDPTLILAIMAIESSFNPFAQSTVGAQGLMQVLTKVHDDKFVAFGGNRAAFDPISNLRVGVQVLKECIQRAGNLQDGLRNYVGAALLETDGGYANRVMAEQGLMRSVADGKRLAPNAVAPVLKSADAQANPAPAAPSPKSTTPSAEPSVSTESVALLR
jgi:Transglycosylase SLT domain